MRVGVGAVKLSPIEQACAHRAEAQKMREGEYQLVMHTETLVAILNDTKIGAENPGVFESSKAWYESITAVDLPIDEVLKLHGASIHLDDRVLVGAVNRRPC